MPLWATIPSPTSRSETMLPVNLYFTPDGQTALRYWRQGGEVTERRVDFPAELLTQAPDPQAEIVARPLTSATDVLFAAFRAMPLRPELDWRLGPGFSEHYQKTFAALLRMLRSPCEKRWCVRGEPGWFLQFGLLEEESSYTLGAFVVPCGKPAVLTFRLADAIERLPLARPFATMDLTSSTDLLPEETAKDVAWDTRIKLPIPDNGSALLRLHPHD